jgi:AraC-like DNA-binding protein
MLFAKCFYRRVDRCSETEPVESALGRWQTVLRRPDPRLRAFVRAYKGYSNNGPVPPHSRHFPGPGVGLIIGFGAGMQVTGPNGLADYSGRRTSFVAGMHDTYTDSQWLGPSHGVQVDFTPIGAHLFFAVSMDTLANRVIELDDVLGVEGQHLVERLRETSGWDVRFRLLELFVASRLIAAGEPSPQVVWAWAEMQRRWGSLNIGELAEELGWSKKHLISRFREQVGLPPKTIARVIRFNTSVEAIGRDPNPDWVQVALDCGYYDQSHLIRDYREFAGVTPTEFLTLRDRSGELSEV